MPFPAAAALIAGGTLGSALLGRSRKQTNTQAQTTTRNLSPVQQRMEELLGSAVEARLQNPAAGLEPIRLAARERVNNTFSNLEGSLRSRLLSSGGKSGKFGSALRAGEIGRLGSLAGLEGDFARLLLERQDQGLSLAQRLLASPQSTTTTSSGASPIPGDALGSGVGGGLQTATFLFALNNLLKGAPTPAGAVDPLGNAITRQPVNSILFNSLFR